MSNGCFETLKWGLSILSTTVTVAFIVFLETYKHTL